jgi:hypothetical protein
MRRYARRRDCERCCEVRGRNAQKAISAPADAGALMLDEFCDVLPRVAGAAHVTARLPPAATIGTVRAGHRLIAVVVRLHAEKTLNAADDAANRCADDRAYRAGDAPAFARAMRDTTRNALSLSSERRCEARRDDACEQ